MLTNIRCGKYNVMYSDEKKPANYERIVFSLNKIVSTIRF